MSRIFPFALLFLLFAGCSQPSAYSKKNAELEIIVQNIQSEVESLKHDIRCQNMEIRMIEGKLNGAQEILNVFKNKIINNYQNQLNDVLSNVKLLKESSSELIKNQKTVKKELELLDFKADTLTKSLNIYNNRVKNIELNIENQELKPKTENKSNFG